MSDTPTSDAQDHWDAVYNAKGPDERSWFQPRPTTSLELMARAGLGPEAAVIDVGGGTSRLVDELLARGHRRICMVEISALAIEQGKARLGTRGQEIEWIHSDIRSAELPTGFDLWHDRAVFHFLTAREDREAYKRNLMRALRPGGHVMIATFAEDGPERCSGLPVRRYSVEELCAEFGSAFAKLDSEHECHITPDGREQRFAYVLLRHAP